MRVRKFVTPMMKIQRDLKNTKRICYENNKQNQSDITFAYLCMIGITVSLYYDLDVRYKILRT
jgi:hypothetical protein